MATEYVFGGSFSQNTAQVTSYSVNATVDYGTILYSDQYLTDYRASGTASATIGGVNQTTSNITAQSGNQGGTDPYEISAIFQQNDGTSVVIEFNYSTPSADYIDIEISGILRANQLDPSTRYSQMVPVAVTRTDVTCFTTGTLIRTARGDVAVEDLIVGDLAVTAAGEHRPIRWIGHTDLDCRTHPRPHEAMPVRVQAGAFGPNRPERDLWLSPGHAVCLDVLGEVFVPVSSLINGATIAQVDVERITYWHVELDSHDVLLANGMPAESYMDCGNRTFFATGQGAIDPDRGAATPADYCRPFHHEGALVAAVRGQAAARAQALGWTVGDDPLADLHLVVDGARIEAEVDGLAARFLVPAGAADVWLVAEAAVPQHVSSDPHGDRRRLGTSVRALSIDDGLGVRRTIALDDARLGEGWHEAEPDHRWTDGRARLPADLWAGCRGLFFLRVDLGGLAVARWTAPEGLELTTAPVVKPAQTGLRLVHNAA